MGIFHLFHHEKPLIEEKKIECRHVDVEADIMEIHRMGGNVDIRKLHPEMTEQEAANYLQELINNHMRRS